MPSEKATSDVQCSCRCDGFFGYGDDKTDETKDETLEKVLEAAIPEKKKRTRHPKKKRSPAPPVDPPPPENAKDDEKKDSVDDEKKVVIQEQHPVQKGNLGRLWHNRQKSRKATLSFELVTKTFPAGDGTIYPVFHRRLDELSEHDGLLGSQQGRTLLWLAVAKQDAYATRAILSAAARTYPKDTVIAWIQKPDRKTQTTPMELASKSGYTEISAILHQQLAAIQNDNLYRRPDDPHFDDDDSFRLSQQYQTIHTPPQPPSKKKKKTIVQQLTSSLFFKRSRGKKRPRRAAQK